MALAHKHSRIGYRILRKLRLRPSVRNKKFDDAHKMYTYLIHYVDGLHESLEAYALQLARHTEAARGLGDTTGHLYGPKHMGFRSAIAFKDAQEQSHSGYAGQIQQAFVKGVIDPVVEWRKQLEKLEYLVSNFNEVQIQHDHYQEKVKELATRAQALEHRAHTHGDGKDARAAAEKLKRNTGKLEGVTKEFERILKQATDGLGKAWADRFAMMNKIVARIILFQETFHAEQLMTGLGVSKLLSTENKGKPLVPDSGIEEFVPKGNIRHYEGALTRKYKVTRARMWFRLVGSTLEVYKLKHIDDPSHVVTETPKATYEVKGVVKTTDTHLTVATNNDETGLQLIAADAADGQAWFGALERASVWDEKSSADQVGTHVLRSQQFLAKCKTVHASSTTQEALEKSLGVTEALANPPDPPAEVPVATGGDASNAGGGGGGQAAGKTAKGAPGTGGKAAAGIAAGGEAGGWGAVPWGYPTNASSSSSSKQSANGGKAAAAAAAAAAGAAAASAVANGSGGGSKGKKKGGRWGKGAAVDGQKVEVTVKGVSKAGSGAFVDEKMPELVDANGNRAGGLTAGAAAAAAAAATAAGGMAASGRMGGPGGMGPRGMPPGGMGGGSMNGQMSRGMSAPMMHGGPRGPMGMMGGSGHQMGGPPPMMQGGPQGQMMMQQSPPAVMMGPNGPVTLMPPSMQGGGMSGGSPVMMGPNGPVTLMGSGPPSQGGQWSGSQFSARGPWGTGMGSRSFGTRFGPQRGRPGIIQRTRSLGMEDVPGPYGFTRDDVLHPHGPGEQQASFSQSDPSQSGPGAAAFGAAGAALGTAAGVAAAGGIAGKEKAGSGIPADSTPEAAVATPSPEANGPSTRGLDASPRSVDTPPVDASVHSNESAPKAESPPVSAVDATTAATSAAVIAATATAAAPIVAQEAASNAAPTPVPAAEVTVETDSDSSPFERTAAPAGLSIDSSAKVTTESAKTSRAALGGRGSAGHWSESGAGSSRAMDSDISSRQKKSYRGIRRMMSFGSGTTGTGETRKFVGSGADGYDGAADSSSGGDARSQSESGSRYRPGSPNHKSRPDRWTPKKPKATMMSDKEKAAVDAGGESKASESTSRSPTSGVEESKLSWVEESKSSWKRMNARSPAKVSEGSSKSYPSPVGGEPARAMTFGEERKPTPTNSTRDDGSSMVETESAAKSSRVSKYGGGVAATAASFLAAAKNRGRSKTPENLDGAAPSSGDFKRPVAQKQSSNASTVVDGFVPPSMTATKTPSVKERIEMMNKKVAKVIGGSEEGGDAKRSGSGSGSGGDVESGTAVAGGGHSGSASFDLNVEGVGVDVGGVASRDTDASAGDNVAIPTVADAGKEKSSEPPLVPSIDISNPFVASHESRGLGSVNTPIGGVVASTPSVDSGMPDLVDSSEQAFAATTSGATSTAPAVSTSHSAAPEVPDNELSDTALPAVSVSGAGEGAGEVDNTAGGSAVVPVSSTPSVGDQEGASARSNGSGNVSSADSSSGDATAAQVKVFHRLCDSQGGGGGGSASEEPTLSFEQLMGWDEVQELIEYGALKESEVKTVWDEALSSQDERTIASTAKAHGDIWGEEETKEEKVDVFNSKREPSTTLTQRGFMILVKLIEELQFEKELEQERGVGLVPGPVCVV